MQTTIFLTFVVSGQSNVQHVFAFFHQRRMGGGQHRQTFVDRLMLAHFPKPEKCFTKRKTFPPNTNTFQHLKKRKFRKNVRILIGHREQMGKKAMGQIFIVKQGGMEG